MSKRAKLLTLDAAAALAAENGMKQLDARWWRRQVQEGRVSVSRGAVPYVTLPHALRIIELATLGAQKPMAYMSLIDVGKLIEGKRLAEAQSDAH